MDKKLSKALKLVQEYQGHADGVRRMILAKEAVSLLEGLDTKEEQTEKFSDRIHPHLRKHV